MKLKLDIFKFKRADNHSPLYLLLFLLLFSSCGEGIKPDGKKTQSNQPVNIIKDAHIYRSSNAEVDIEIFAPLINNFEGDSGKMEFPKGAKAVFLNRDMSVKSVITADYAVNKKPSNDFLLQRNVVIVNYNSHDTIYCEDLVWLSENGRIYTQQPVCRQSISGTDYGDGLEANETMDSVIVLHPHGRQKVEE